MILNDRTHVALADSGHGLTLQRAMDDAIFIEIVPER
jgi:hypothetical protein